MKKVEWLCLNCLSHLLPRVSLKQRSIHPKINHYYLIDWVEGDGLTPLVHSLKGGRCLWAFQFLSEYFSTNKEQAKTIYYPTKGNKDHAFQLAYCLAQKRSSAEIVPLQKITPFKQALLSRRARSKIVYEIQKPIKRQAYLADDIVTTGATALACYRALGQPHKMTVWSLFYRKYL